jgi:hypothetical protein
MSLPANQQEDMLHSLECVRGLLTAPNAENVRAANVELGRIAASVTELSIKLPTHQESAPTILEFLRALRLALLTIATLSQKGAEHFQGMGLLRASRFGAYERSGRFRTLETTSRLSVQL